jgi:predicted phosphodiesterase
MPGPGGKRAPGSTTGTGKYEVLPVKKILIVSDLHVGSNVAIMPDEVFIEPSDKQREQRIESNPLQKAIFNEWLEMLDTVGRVDACFDLGDNIEGANYKSRGFELWTSNLHQQCNTAADLLGMVKTNRYYGVQGSYYHVGENVSSDLAVLSSLEHCKTEFGTDLAVNIEGVRIHLSHEIGYTRSQASKLTALKNEMDAARRQFPKIGKFHLICRGHRHEIQDVIDHENDERMIVCPCWKGRDSFAGKKGLAMIPTLGYFLMTIRGSSITLEANTFSLCPHQLVKEVTL